MSGSDNTQGVGDAASTSSHDDSTAVSPSNASDARAMTQTPIRRLQDKSLGFSPKDPLEPPWTTSRCFRLLRPVCAPIKRLHGLHAGRNLPRDYIQGLHIDLYKVHRSESPTAVEDSLSHLAHPEKSLLDGSSTESEGDEVADPNWHPQGGRSKRMKVYRSQAATVIRRNVPSATVRNDTEEVWLRTIMNQNIDLPSLWGTEEPGKRRSRVQEFTRVTDHCRAIEDNLLLGVKAVIVQSQSSKISIPSVGVPSLVMLCLKNIPAHIEFATAKALAEGSDENEDQIADQVFTDLIGKFSLENNEWKPIRIVVRAVVLSDLGKAIAQGVLSPFFVFKLTTWFNSINIVKEDKEIVFDALHQLLAQAHQPNLRAYSMKVLDLYLSWGPSMLINLYRELTKYPDTSKQRKILFFQFLSELVGRRIIPVEWLCCAEIVEIWTPSLDFYFSSIQALWEASDAWCIVFLMTCGIAPKDVKKCVFWQDTAAENWTDAGMQAADTIPALDENLTTMVTHFVATWTTLARLFCLCTGSNIAMTMICNMANIIIRHQEKSSIKITDLPPGIRHRRAVILFAAMILPALQASDVPGACLPVKRISMEWVELSHDVPLKRYVPRLLGPRYSPYVMSAFQRSDSFFLRVVERLFNSGSDLVTRTVQSVVQMSGSKGYYYECLPMPNCMRKQLLRIASDSASKLFKMTPKLTIGGNTIRELVQSTSNEYSKCLAFDNNCDHVGHDPTVRGNDWYWDADLDEYVRARGSKHRERSSGIYSGDRRSQPAAPCAFGAGTLSALTDTPAPARSTMAVPLRNTSTDQAEQLGRPEDATDDELSDIMYFPSLDGCYDFREDDEISILRECPVFLSTLCPSDTTTSGSKGDESVKKSARQLGPSQKLVRSESLNRVDSQPKPQSKSRTRAALSDRDIDPAARRSFKRKRTSIIERGIDALDTSEDELAS